MTKEKLISVSLSKKYILAFRMVMIFLSVFSLTPIYNAFSSGVFVTHGMKFDISSSVIYIYSIKYFLTSAVFMWLGTGGCKVKN